MNEELDIIEPSKAGEIVEVIIQPGDDDVDPVLWDDCRVLTGTVVELLEEVRKLVKYEDDIMSWPTGSIVIYDKFDRSEIGRCSLAGVFNRDKLK
jgi:hypothetical protein